MNISVVVCTRNRGASLAPTLESLRTQRAPADLQWEVIVVDNNSNDSTSAVVERFVKAPGSRFRYVLEARTGKSIALNRGVSEARGSVVAFTDDDCVVDGDWLARIACEFAADRSLGLLGGRVELFDPKTKAETLSLHRERVVLSSPSELFSFIIGCNLAVRSEAFQAANGFDPALGPGTKAVAEDVDFVYTVFKQGFRVVYEPSVLVYHNHGRVTDSEMAPVLKQYAIGRGAFYCKHVLRRDPDIVKLLYWETIASLRMIAVGWWRSGKAKQEGQKRAQILRDYVRGAIYWVGTASTGVGSRGAINMTAGAPARPGASKLSRSRS